MVEPPVHYLWILRHAKAASDAPWGGSDKDRPLTAHGRRDASALGRRLAADPIDLRFGRRSGTEGPGGSERAGGSGGGDGELDLDLDDGGSTGHATVRRPEIALCSAAVRTRQTADLVLEGMGGERPVSAYQSLYSADPDLVLQYVREIDEGVDSALLVGHNPTVFDLAFQLLADPAVTTVAPEFSDRDLLEVHGFPTCALAVLSLAVGAWEDVAHGCGTLAGVFKPPY
jgi:phosphohistidine phosphatase